MSNGRDLLGQLLRKADARCVARIVAQRRCVKRRLLGDEAPDSCRASRIERRFPATQHLADRFGRVAHQKHVAARLPGCFDAPDDVARDTGGLH